MTQLIQASSLSLHEVEENFNLQQVWESKFFSEWQIGLLELNEHEKHWLDRIRADFLRLAKYHHEEIVKMYVLSPLLSLAGLTSDPFIPEAEHPVEIEVENDDDDKIIRGKIDFLILHQQLWAIVIETKRQSLNVTEALPQVLSYMMSSPDKSWQSPSYIYGFILNGTEFLFLKLVRQDEPRYALSKLFSLINPGNDLYEVLGILKLLREVVLTR